jgi:hypothetical protein
MPRSFTAAEAGYTYEGAVNLNVKSCPTCGITYAMPSALDDAAHKYNRAEYPNETVEWHCPNGHRLGYSGKSEEQRLRERLEREKDRRAYQAARADRAEASARAQKGAATRARRERDDQIRKIEKGICPAKGCGRHFKNVRLHMASKHPELAAKVKAEDV